MMLRLGFVYANGERGFVKNDREAFGFFKRSADRGHPNGQALAGTLYLTGRGVDRNVGLGMHLLTRGAERGSAYGCQLLGQCFEKGAHGFPKDPQQAAAWHNRAATLCQPATPRQPSIIFADNRLQDTLGRIAARDREPPPHPLPPQPWRRQPDERRLREEFQRQQRLAAQQRRNNGAPPELPPAQPPPEALPQPAPDAEQPPPPHAQPPPHPDAEQQPPPEQGAEQWVMDLLAHPGDDEPPQQAPGAEQPDEAPPPQHDAPPPQPAAAPVMAAEAEVLD